MNRYRDALMISDGACNPSGVALAIAQACREIHATGGDTKAIANDPAVRLMVHQLAFICGVPTNETLTAWEEWRTLCHQHEATAEVVNGI